MSCLDSWKLRLCNGSLLCKDDSVAVFVVCAYRLCTTVHTRPLPLGSNLCEVLWEFTTISDRTWHKHLITSDWPYFVHIHFASFLLLCLSEPDSVAQALTFLNSSDQSAAAAWHDVLWCVARSVVTVQVLTQFCCFDDVCTEMSYWQTSETSKIAVFSERNNIRRDVYKADNRIWSFILTARYSMWT